MADCAPIGCPRSRLCPTHLPQPPRPTHIPRRRTAATRATSRSSPKISYSDDVSPFPKISYRLNEVAGAKIGGSLCEVTCVLPFVQNHHKALSFQASVSAWIFQSSANLGQDGTISWGISSLRSRKGPSAPLRTFLRCPGGMLL